jgi:hypothetical protein
MPLDLPQRLAATGMAGLAVLSATHWARDHVADPGPLLASALGVMPSMAAAFAMPLIVASFTRQTSTAPITRASRVAFARLLAFTTLGLLGWELVQTRSAAFVFDTHDLLATVVGAMLAHVAFVIHTRSAWADPWRTPPGGGSRRRESSE